METPFPVTLNPLKCVLYVYLATVSRNISVSCQSLGLLVCEKGTTYLPGVVSRSILDGKDKAVIRMELFTTSSLLLLADLCHPAAFIFMYPVRAT